MFKDNIENTWKNLNSKTDFYDITIACEGIQLQGHKIIFSSCSPTFKEVLKADKNQHSNRWRRTMYFVYINDGSSFWPGWTAKRQLLDRYDWS